MRSADDRPAFARGAFAAIRVATNASGLETAVKTYHHKVQGVKDASLAFKMQEMHEMHLANEKKLVGKLKHAFIIAPHSMQVLGDRTEFSMEFAIHGSLEAYIARCGANGSPGVSEPEGQRLFAQIASAIDYLHGLRVAHRDIKLENVVLDSEMRARVIDFGSAERLVDGGWLSAVQGSPGYMAPEVLLSAAHAARNSRPSSGRSRETHRYDALAADVWSLGVLLFAIFNSTELPYRARDVQELIRLVSTAPVPACDHPVSSACNGLMERLMAKQPASRPAASALMRHPWVTAAALDAPTVPSIPAGVPTTAAAAATAAERPTSSARPLTAGTRPNTGQPGGDGTTRRDVFGATRRVHPVEKRYADLYAGVGVQYISEHGGFKQGADDAQPLRGAPRHDNGGLLQGSDRPPSLAGVSAGIREPDFTASISYRGEFFG